MIQTKVLKQQLITHWLGSHLVELDKIDSTNSYAKTHASQLRHGSLVLAHEQLKGRGQAQKYWHSTALQNIHISIYLKPNREEGLHLLTFIPALSILTLLQNLGFTGLVIKWPNDLYLNDKKLAGVLTENTYQGGRFQSTILGAGWNVNEEHFPAELTESATSLIQELPSEQHSLDRDQLQKYLDSSPELIDTGPTSIDRDFSSVNEDSLSRNKWSKTQLLIDFLAQFEHFYTLWETHPGTFANQINAHLLGYGKQVSLLRLDQPNTHAESVKCLGLDESGGYVYWIKRWKSILLRMNKSELNLSNLLSDQPVLDLQKSLITHDLWGKKLLIGVSGGVDSMALLTALKDLDQQVMVVHINYGLRGADSDLDQELVEQMSQFYGFEMASFSVFYSKEVGNLQAWARNIRYEYFEALRIEEDCDAIVLAHHRDDQVETLIQKIFRSSSPQNWMGMKAWDEQRHLLRPWLSITKKEILAYASSKAVPFREDASNNQTKYNRNWIRNRWKPDLDQHFPGWEANVLGMQEYAQLLGQYRDYWLSESVSTREKEDHEGISISKLATCPEMMRQDLLKAFIEAHSLYDANEHLSAGILVEAVKLMEAETGSMVPISDRLLIYRDRDQLRLSPSDAFDRPLSGDSPVEFHKASLPKKQLGFSFALQSLEQMNVPLAEQTDLYLDVHAVQWPLRLRTWKPGDRFNPIGMKGHVKISDFLVNRKVPRHIKSGYLVLEDGNKKIIAVLYPPQNNNESNHVGIPSDDHKCSIDTFEVMMVTRMESS